MPVTPSPDNGEVELLGVCSYTENSVSCWKPNGTSAKEIEPSVDGLLRSGYGNQGRMRYGYKNRIIVFSRPQQASVTYRSGEVGGENSSLETQQTNETFGPRIDAVFVATSVGTTSGAIVAKVQRPGVKPKTADLPLKAGSQATVDGVKVRITAVKKMTPSDPYYNSGFPESRNHPRWKVETTVDRAANPESYSGFQLFGLDGNPIQYVDAKGKPLLRPAFGTGEPVLQAMSFVGNNSGGTDMVLLVDPALVKRVQFGVTRPRLGVFKDIPLDPKG